ncbi:MAG: transporter [Planctomycetota bacterium]
MVTSAALVMAGRVGAQDLEPRRWTHLPAGSLTGSLTYVHTRGDVIFDPVLQLDDVTVESDTVVASVVHAFDLFGVTGRFDLIAPWQDIRWKGLVSGAPASRSQQGFDDPWVRLSINLAGAPALRGKEFVEYQQAHPDRTVVGVGFGAKLPLGKYDPDRLLNIGQNRFAFMSQLGAVHYRGPWSFELTGTTLLFTRNDDFFGGNTLEQDPVFAVQGHVVHTFANRWWVSAGAGYTRGGESRINGVAKDDERVNLFTGLAFGMPIGGSQGLKLAYIRGDAREAVGSDTDSLLLSWTIRF